MKSFFAALIAVAGIGLVSDFLLGGSVSKSGVFGEEVAEMSGTMVRDTSAAGAYVGANVRLPAQRDRRSLRYGPAPQYNPSGRGQ